MICELLKNLESQAEYIKENFAEAKIIKPIKNNNLIIYVDKGNIVKFLKFLRDDDKLSFKILIDLFGADLVGIRFPRFEIIYNLLSLKLNNRITVKVALKDEEKLETVSGVFSTANWLEREVFDMYGIKFINHPDLRRILTDYGFEGHPLRKDFPLTGYKEVEYDKEKKKVVYKDVDLEQEFRDFDFEMPWKGTKYQIQKDQE